MKKSTSTLLMALSLVLASCFGGGSGGGGSNPPSSIGYGEASDFVYYLNEDSGALDQGSFYLEKHNTLSGSGWVVVWDDDYNEYRAVNVWAYDGYSDAYYFYENASRDVFYSYTDVYGNPVYEDYSGNLFEQTKATAKDLEKLGQKIEKLNLKKVEEHLVGEFGLSESRAFTVAKLVQGWKKASKSRQMTNEDSKVFFKEVLGFDANEGLKAFKKSMEGDSTDLDELIVKAAETNDTTPEHMKEILSSTLIK
mgnify:CR=1 FL=1